MEIYGSLVLPHLLIDPTETTAGVSLPRIITLLPGQRDLVLQARYRLVKVTCKNSTPDMNLSPSKAGVAKQ